MYFLDVKEDSAKQGKIKKIVVGQRIGIGSYDSRK